MAIDYSSSGLFAVLGKYIKHINSYETLLSDIATDQNDIETVLNTAGLIHMADDLKSDFEGFQDRVTGWINEIKSRMDAVLLDRDSVIDQLPVSSNASVQEVLLALIEDMVDGGEDVLKSQVGLPSVTYDAENGSGDIGVLVKNNYLDGAVSVDSGAPVVSHYADYFGITGGNPAAFSQMARAADTITFTCITDSENGAEVGAEVWSVAGGPATPPYSKQEEQSGSGGSVATASLSGSQAFNGGFDSWPSQDNPTGWAISSGAYGTDYDKSGTNVVRGGNSLRLINGSTGLTMSINIPASYFTRRRTFILGYWVYYTGAGTEPTGTITLRDGPTTVVQSSDLGAAGGGWQHVMELFNVGKELMNEQLTLEIAIDTSLATVDLWIDDICLVPLFYFDGIGFAIFSGPDKWIKGDQIMASVTNNNAGVFQTAFRKLYGVQLPTVTSSPSIAEAWAT